MKVIIREILEKEIEVSDSYYVHGAFNIVEEMYDNTEVVLTAENHTSTELYCYDEQENIKSIKVIR